MNRRSFLKSVAAGIVTALTGSQVAQAASVVEEEPLGGYVDDGYAFDPREWSILPPDVVARLQAEHVVRHPAVYLGKGGHDSNDGLTWRTRVRTLGRAATIAGPGGVVYTG